MVYIDDDIAPKISSEVGTIGISYLITILYVPTFKLRHGITFTYQFGV